MVGDSVSHDNYKNHLTGVGGGGGDGCGGGCCMHSIQSADSIKDVAFFLVITVQACLMGYPVGG